MPGTSKTGIEAVMSSHLRKRAQFEMKSGKLPSPEAALALAIKESKAPRAKVKRLEKSIVAEENDYPKECRKNTNDLLLGSSTMLGGAFI